MKIFFYLYILACLMISGCKQRKNNINNRVINRDQLLKNNSAAELLDQNISSDGFYLVPPDVDLLNFLVYQYIARINVCTKGKISIQTLLKIIDEEKLDYYIYRPKSSPQTNPKGFQLTNDEDLIESTIKSDKKWAFGYLTPASHKAIFYTNNLSEVVFSPKSGFIDVSEQIKTGDHPLNTHLMELAVSDAVSSKGLDPKNFAVIDNPLQISRKHTSVTDEVVLRKIFSESITAALKEKPDLKKAFIPIANSRQNHASTVTIDFEKGEIVYYDSFGKTPEKPIKGSVSDQTQFIQSVLDDNGKHFSVRTVEIDIQKRQSTAAGLSDNKMCRRYSCWIAAAQIKQHSSIDTIIQEVEDTNLGKNDGRTIDDVDKAYLKRLKEMAQPFEKLYSDTDINKLLLTDHWAPSRGRTLSELTPQQFMRDFAYAKALVGKELDALTGWGKKAAPISRFVLEKQIEILDLFKDALKRKFPEIEPPSFAEVRKFLDDENLEEANKKMTSVREHYFQLVDDKFNFDLEKKIGDLVFAEEELNGLKQAMENQQKRLGGDIDINRLSAEDSRSRLLTMINGLDSTKKLHGFIDPPPPVHSRPPKVNLGRFGLTKKDSDECRENNETWFKKQIQVLKEQTNLYDEITFPLFESIFDRQPLSP